MESQNVELTDELAQIDKDEVRIEVSKLIVKHLAEIQTSAIAANMESSQ